jgi:hypothetical protein
MGKNFGATRHDVYYFNIEKKVIHGRMHEKEEYPIQEEKTTSKGTVIFLSFTS